MIQSKTLYDIVNNENKIIGHLRLIPIALSKNKIYWESVISQTNERKKFPLLYDAKTYLGKRKLLLL